MFRGRKRGVVALMLEMMLTSMLNDSVYSAHHHIYVVLSGNGASSSSSNNKRSVAVRRSLQEVCPFSIPPEQLN